MPVYNYACLACDAAFEVRIPYSEVDTAQPSCPRCGGHDCQRLISRVNVSFSDGAEPFRLTREHVEAAAGYANLMQGSGHAHGQAGCACGGSCGCGH